MVTVLSGSADTVQKQSNCTFAKNVRTVQASVSCWRRGARAEAVVEMELPCSSGAFVDILAAGTGQQPHHERAGARLRQTHPSAPTTLASAISLVLFLSVSTDFTAAAANILGQFTPLPPAYIQQAPYSTQTACTDCKTIDRPRWRAMAASQATISPTPSHISLEAP